MQDRTFTHARTLFSRNSPQNPFKKVMGGGKKRKKNDRINGREIKHIPSHSIAKPERVTAPLGHFVVCKSGRKFQIPTKRHRYFPESCRQPATSAPNADTRRSGAGKVARLDYGKYKELKSHITATKGARAVPRKGLSSG